MTICGGGSTDQLVPSASLQSTAVANQTQQRTVKKTVIPDFQNLLLNSSGSLDTPDLIPKDEFSYPTEDPTDFMNKPFSAFNWGLEDVSMYEGMPVGSLVDKKPKLAELQPVQPAVSPAPVASNQMLQEPVIAPMSDDLRFVKLEPFTPEPEAQQAAIRPFTLDLPQQQLIHVQPQQMSPAPDSAATTPCSTQSYCDSPDSSGLDEGIFQDMEDMKKKIGRAHV